MKKIYLPKEFLLDKKELAKICGGTKYYCSCYNEDGTWTMLEYEADSPQHCAELCRKYWEENRDHKGGL